LRNDRHEVVWSKDFYSAGANLGDLKQQAAYTTAKVLECAIETRGSGGSQLSPQLVKLYLNGCAGYADMNENSLRNLVTVFTRVADGAPAFRAVWPRLLMSAQSASVLDTNPDYRELRRLVDRAKKIDPSLPEIALSEAAMLPPDAVAARMALVMDAVQKHPDNINALNVAVDDLVGVGRLTDAVSTATRRVALDPISPSAREQLVITLATAGQMTEADRQLRNAEALWPGAISLRAARYLLYLRFGDPKEAIRAREGGGWVPGTAPYQVSFLAARTNPTPANVERALADARAFYAKEPGTLFNLMQTLGAFGRNEELFSMLLDEKRPIDVASVLSVVFRPGLHGFRRDPRFMRVAQRVGLLNYWQKTGQWPDLCYETDLPYNCKAEAAKLAHS